LEAKMLKVGQKKQARYWGSFEVVKVAKLDKPVVCRSK